MIRRFRGNKKAVFEVHEFIKTGKTPKPFMRKMRSLLSGRGLYAETMGCKRSVREYW